jgi:Uma2 family endonuclease
MTYEEFLSWAPETQRAEWIDGEVIVMTAPSEMHQDLILFLGALLRHLVEAYNLGRVWIAPYQMKLEFTGREPDILFLSREHFGRKKKLYLDGPADLVVEVISPDSRARDRGEKFYEYEQAGIPEYWLLDPARKQAEFYGLSADGIYHLLPIDSEGVFRSTVLEGLWLKVEWLWQDPLPKLATVLKAWGLSNG